MQFKSIISHQNRAFCRQIYTWGKNTGSLGYSVSSQVLQTNIPQKIEANLDSQVKKVVMGPYHSAIITQKGNLYTFGYDGYGCLGHNDGILDKHDPKVNKILPRKVQFFEKNALEVIDVAIGDRHTQVLTSDGDVFTMGYGGRNTNFFINLFFSSCGALGHGDNENRHTPTPVKGLRDHPAIVSISSGYYFANALTETKELFNWGRGDYGVFGNGESKSLWIPKKNDYFAYLKDSEKLSIKTLKSANNYSVALMSDGNLYGWGSNESGQMGIKTEIGVEMYETANFATSVVNEMFKGKKIVQFDISEDIMVVLLDTNEVYWSGMKLEYTPSKMMLDPSIKIKQVTACRKAIGVLTGMYFIQEDNRIFMKNDFVKHQKENIDNGILETDNSIFQNGTILEIGGMYNNRFAIVEKH